MQQIYGMPSAVNSNTVEGYSSCIRNQHKTLPDNRSRFLALRTGTAGHAQNQQYKAVGFRHRGTSCERQIDSRRHQQLGT